MSPASPAGEGPGEAVTGTEDEGVGTLNLNSYYHSFDETGCRSVDKLLAAAADAGHRSHHTESWSERESRDADPSPAEAIQQAGRAAAAEASRMGRELVAAQARAEEVERERDEARAENARLRLGKDRFKAGTRAAITWLHLRAWKMNDMNARAVLDSAATNLGWDLAAGRVPSGALAPTRADDGGENKTLAPTRPHYVQVRNPLTCDWIKLATDTGLSVEIKEGDPFEGVPIWPDILRIVEAKADDGGDHA